MSLVFPPLKSPLFEANQDIDGEYLSLRGEKPSAPFLVFYCQKQAIKDQASVKTGFHLTKNQFPRKCFRQKTPKTFWQTTQILSLKSANHAKSKSIKSIDLISLRLDFCYNGMDLYQKTSLIFSFFDIKRAGTRLKNASPKQNLARSARIAKPLLARKPRSLRSPYRLAPLALQARSARKKNTQPNHPAQIVHLIYPM